MTNPACWLWKPPTDATMERVRKMFSARFWEKCDETERRRLLMAVWQNDRCAICGTRPRCLLTDHDHATGLVRGYLCPSCNTLEGNGHVDDEYTRYRERPPAVICGYRDYYYDPYLKTYARPGEGEVLA